MVLRNWLTSCKGCHVINNKHGQDWLDQNTRDGGLVNAKAEEQVCKGVDDDDCKWTSIHEALQWGRNACCNDGHKVSTSTNCKKSRSNTKDGQGQHHWNHGVKRICNRWWNALTKADLQLLNAGELNEDSGRKQANDDCTKEAVSTGEGSGESTSYINARNCIAGWQKLSNISHRKCNSCSCCISGVCCMKNSTCSGNNALRHHDDKCSNTNNNARDCVFKTLVTSEAITNNACKNNCRETQSALSNCCAPNLEISQGNWIICKDEWEQNVVDQYCNTSQNVNWADSCKCIAQAPQMNLITYFCRNFCKFI